MKINLLIATLVISCLNVFGQAKPKYGTPEYFVNKHFILDTSALSVSGFSSSGVENFVKDYKKDSKFFTDFNNFSSKNVENNIIYKDPKMFRASSYDSLKNVVFVCEKAAVDDHLNYLLLNSAKTGPVYYVFERSSFFILPTYKSIKCVEDLTKENAAAAADNKEFEAIKNVPCAGITYEYNKVDKAKEFNTPLDGGGRSFNCSFSKRIQNGVPSYTLYLSTRRDPPRATKEGVTILLKNGKKINKPAVKVTSTVDEGSGYLRSAIFTLTPADITLLKTSPIETYKLYIDDESPDDEDALYKMFICLLTKK
ncbi:MULTISPECIES: hypothetical protein [unclassified Mucilaginibacter]|uniref:hypothetical protein n=3 Tax=Mucilaginibacter TaxID=423349 RepID=UPI002AC9800C|nr:MULTISPECIES: hypothetical protein [unclassified Mucilaginibacter]MEB0262654.1 hypothetical protein [Mucilaginibacter sp. 10I4]MEB0280606.1 hypothetical protein [Mucilaginibacter sp. 10B2]WPX24976.1 hypothetical protein RHM67_06835 [Mucilaginibacter sp. 5C4]